jgi:hypothetical protein
MHYIHHLAINILSWLYYSLLSESKGINWVVLIVPAAVVVLIIFLINFFRKTAARRKNATKNTEDFSLEIAEKNPVEKIILSEGEQSFVDLAAKKNIAEAAKLREQAAKLEKEATDLMQSCIPAKKEISRHALEELNENLEGERIKTSLLQERIRQEKILSMAETERKIAALQKRIMNAKYSR